MAGTAEPIIDYLSAHVPIGDVTLEGTLSLPQEAAAVVLFAHGSGSGRHSPRSRHVANVLNEARLATLLIDLLTPEEEEFDIGARRMISLGGRSTTLRAGRSTFSSHCWGKRASFTSSSSGSTSLRRHALDRA